MEEIKIILNKKLPKEIVYKILYYHKGLEHPTAVIMNKVISDCIELTRLESGGWEEFDTFLNCYDRAGKRPDKATSLKFYRENLIKW